MVAPKDIGSLMDSLERDAGRLHFHLIKMFRELHGEPETFPTPMPKVINKLDEHLREAMALNADIRTYVYEFCRRERV
jgi:hypothetical protein